MKKNMKTEIGKTMYTLKAKRLRFYILGVALPVVHILIFYFYANFNSILLAFQDYNGSSFAFVGFDNFVGIFNGTHPRLIKFNMGYILKNSFLSFGMELLFGSLPAILFSYYIYKKYPAAGTFKIILYIPHIIPSIIFVILYKYFVGSAIPEIYEKLQAEEQESADRKARYTKMLNILKVLENSESMLETFDENIWNTVLENITVFHDGSMIFLFKDGSEVKI